MIFRAKRSRLIFVVIFSSSSDLSGIVYILSVDSAIRKHYYKDWCYQLAWIQLAIPSCMLVLHSYNLWVNLYPYELKLLPWALYLTDLFSLRELLFCLNFLGLIAKFQLLCVICALWTAFELKYVVYMLKILLILLNIAILVNCIAFSGLADIWTQLILFQ